MFGGMQKQAMKALVMPAIKSFLEQVEQDPEKFRSQAIEYHPLLLQYISNWIDQQEQKHSAQLQGRKLSLLLMKQESDIFIGFVPMAPTGPEKPLFWKSLKELIQEAPLNEWAAKIKESL